MTGNLPLGKLPPHLLGSILADAPLDESVVVGPGIGLDCAVVESGGRLLVMKTDPITFSSDQIGWYVVQINANDIATTGASPRWFMANLLLPESRTGESLAGEIMAQVYAACRELGISVVGGHTEVTYGLERPVLVGTMIGEVAQGKLVNPRNIQPGDVLLLTKGVPIEATAIIAREFSDRLQGKLSPADIKRAADFLYDPGISVLRDAGIAMGAGRVHAIHDPTEGGLAAALWEMAEASSSDILFDPSSVPVPDTSAVVLQALDDRRLDPLTLIASGALLMAVHPDDAEQVTAAFSSENILCRQIGNILGQNTADKEQGSGASVYYQERGEMRLFSRPFRDAITYLYEGNFDPLDNKSIPTDN